MNPEEKSAAVAPRNRARTAAFLVLRFWLAACAIASGASKFAVASRRVSEDPETGETVVSLVREYAFGNYVGVPAREFERLLGDPLLPDWTLHAFRFALGPVLILAGAALLLGAGTRVALCVLGAVFVALSFGLSLTDPSGSAGTLGVYVLAVAAALLLADANRFCVSVKY